MILLNEPWSIYEKRIALERRRRVVRLAIVCWLLAIGLVLAALAGRVLAYLGI